ncbi:MAG: DNA polymerase III subunit gamma/tau [Bacteroidaceae bacterium]|nr:DNA polymerase III subunit gamma/tau [Bacteroidaceae bacterium]
MEEYIVSARKYRPLTFDSVVGQRALTTTLRNAISTGKLAHAYLFCGPRGVGKTTCARIFAKTINCLTPTPEGEACGECESCLAFNEQRSMSIHELDAASNNSVEDIRELIKQVQIPPQIGRYKVFIIDEVHMLSSAAFNAFLKTLEEPPSYVIFILATTEKHKILPTILSRCQVYDFQRMTTQGMVDHLRYVAEKEGYTAEDEALNLIAQKADGGMRDALSIFDQMVSFTGGNLTYDLVCQNLNVLGAEYYFRFVDHFLKCEVEPCLLLFNEVLMKGFDAGNFIGGLASHLRDLLVSRDEQTLPLLDTSEQMRARYHEQALRCKPKFLYRAIKLCNDCDQAYRTSRNKRLQVEICLIQAAQLEDEDSPGAGRGPAKILKPIFAELAAARKRAQASHVTPQSPAPATSHSAPVSARPESVSARPAPATVEAVSPTVQSAPSQPTSDTVRPASAATQPAPATAQPTPSRAHAPYYNVGGSPLSSQIVGEPSSSPSAHASVSSAPSPLPKLKLRGFGARKEPTPEAAPVVVEDKKEKVVTPLNDGDVFSAWFAFINLMPQEHKAMASRMRNMKPIVEGTSTISVTVGNERVADYLRQLAPQIEAFVCPRLQNDEAHLDVKVSAAEEAVRIFSKPERLRGMLSRNAALRELATSLQLELE